MNTTEYRHGQPASAAADPALDDPRLIRAVQEYQAAMEAGERPNRRDFLARYPDLAEPLAECLEALEFVHTVGPRLEQPAAPSAAAPYQAFALPSDQTVPLGDFRIVREIGRGGMGVVYEAEQLSLGRRIALKVLPFALTLDPRQLQRFKNEARAAAHLHHTNIVPIYSVGCERGVHFYAMQYIEGQPLTQVIDELRQLAGRVTDRDGPARATGTPLPRRDRAGEDQTTPYGPPAEQPQATVGTVSALRTTGGTLSRPLGSAIFQTVARLGVQAAEALEHAHQLGVIHRDIKPGNILVDSANHLWITDFGLAQFQNSDAVLTMTGDLVGTLRYMSPEQTRAQRGLVDHRADIYSLGATLYELLTLEPTFTSRDRHELLRQIAGEEPAPLRRLNEKVPVDLETIVLKAMAKTVEERYATAQELADDLRRFLDNKPILAKRPTLWERTVKWTRRHQAMVRVAVALLGLLAFGFAASTLLIAREQARTKTAYEAEARQRELADENFEQARQMLNFFTLISDEELADIPEAQEVRRKLLRAALEYYQEFINKQGDNPAIREELAASHLRVASILHEIGSRAEALNNLEQARRIQEGLARENPAAAEQLRRLFAIEQNLDWLRDGNQFLLLTQLSVQEEVKLTPTQVTRITQLSTKRREAYRDHNNVSPEEWRTRLEGFRVQEKTILADLNADQSRRLKQIAWQKSGVSAFSEARVAEALELTSSQQEQIHAIQEEARRARGGSSSGGLRAEPWKRPDNTGNLERILNVLTDEQRRAWDSLIGAPFHGEIRLGFRRGPESGPPRPPKRP